MARKKDLRDPRHQPFEAINPKGRFVKFTEDFAKSAAWQALTLTQRGLYLEFKIKYRQRMDHGILIYSNVDDISMPESEWRKFYGDYRTFRRDYERLIQLGFLRLIQAGQKHPHTEHIRIFGWLEEVYGIQHPETTAEV
ncbi:MAG: hypothetical protein ACOX6O_06920 [Christensenellales bacterium]|jgi:hypothetical protein